MGNDYIKKEFLDKRPKFTERVYAHRLLKILEANKYNCFTCPAEVDDEFRSRDMDQIEGISPYIIWSEDSDHCKICLEFLGFEAAHLFEEAHFVTS